MFSWVRYKFGILQVKCYIGIISVHLRIILCPLIFTNKHFWHRCQENGCWIKFEPGLTLYHYSFIFYLFILFHPYPPICCTYERTPRATRIFKAYPDTSLWVAPMFNQHGPGSIFFGRRWWKSIPPPKWVWANLYMLTYCRHLRRNLMMEAFFFLFKGKS
jgi:hypothetical protein